MQSMQAVADLAESCFSAGQIGFGYDMGAVAEAENSKVDAGHSLEVQTSAQMSPLQESHAKNNIYCLPECLWQ